MMTPQIGTQWSWLTDKLQMENSGIIIYNGTSPGMEKKQNLLVFSWEV